MKTGRLILNSLYLIAGYKIKNFLEQKTIFCDYAELSTTISEPGTA